MNRDQCWLTDPRFSKIEPHLPTDTRGGRATKIHPLTGAQCRPLAFMLTSGQVADCTAAAALLERLPKCDVLHADKGYDANAGPVAKVVGIGVA